MFTIYTTPSCMACRATKKFLDDRGVAYETVDLLEDPTRLQEFRDAGYGSAPIVQVGEHTWSGFRPDLLKSHTEAQAKAHATPG